MRFKRHLELEKGRLDIAPLIDVIFLLLIFFMLTSSFILQPGIKVNLPAAITSKIVPKENLEILINNKDHIYISKTRITVDELTSRLRMASKQETPVLIRSDKKASLGKVVKVWDLCREVGISNVNIATVQQGGGK